VDTEETAADGGTRTCYSALPEPQLFKFLQEKAVKATKQKEEKRKRKACHSVSTALQSHNSTNLFTINDTINYSLYGCMLY
jgi:hypothetical protein